MPRHRVDITYQAAVGWAEFVSADFSGNTFFRLRIRA